MHSKMFWRQREITYSRHHALKMNGEIDLVILNKLAIKFKF